MSQTRFIDCILDLAPAFCLSVLSTLFIKSSRSISIPLTLATTVCSLPKLSPLLISSAKTNENNAIPITIINTDDLPLIVFNIAIVS